MGIWKKKIIDENFKIVLKIRKKCDIKFIEVFKV